MLEGLPPPSPYVKEALSIDQKVINGLKIFSDSHSYHDDIEFYIW